MGLTRDELARAAERWVEVLWVRGQADAVDELHTPDFVDRSPAERPPTNEGFALGVREIYAAFPDFETRIEDLIIDTERARVGIVWTATGTHRGAFVGYPPTGQVVRFRGIEVLRVAPDGRVFERWGEWEGVDVLEQLSATRN
jgi:steroid delta-isomerase-like uncharacterized protein